MSKFFLFSLLSLAALEASSTRYCIGEDDECAAIVVSEQPKVDLDECEEMMTFVLNTETIEQLMDDFVRSDTGTRYALLFVKETKK